MKFGYCHLLKMLRYAIDHGLMEVKFEIGFMFTFISVFQSPIVHVVIN